MNRLSDKEIEDCMAYTLPNDWFDVCAQHMLCTDCLVELDIENHSHCQERGAVEFAESDKVRLPPPPPAL
jgi:hypothetical protein